MLSNGDFTKWDYFLKLGVVEFMNLISFVKDKREHENDLIRSHRGE